MQQIIIVSHAEWEKLKQRIFQFNNFKISLSLVKTLNKNNLLS